MKCLQVLLFNTNYSISILFIYLHSINGSKYCDVLQIIQFRHTVKEFQVLLFNIIYGVVANELDSNILVSSNSCRVITFTFGLMPFENVWKPLPPPPGIVWIVPLVLFYDDDFGSK